MEIRRTFRTVPSRPIALVVAALAVLALALTAWYVLGTSVQTHTTVKPRTLVTISQPQNCGDPYSPHDPICAPAPDPYSPHDPLN